MGLIDRVTGAGLREAGAAAEGLSEVFVPNATREMELAAEARRAALDAAAAEFAHAGTHPFDRAVNGLNRLPRPLLALGTLGLFVHAMVDPAGFALRMRGLAEVPEPLWWLMGAIVGFYFGARELHYLRAPLRGPGLAAALGGLAGRRAARPAPGAAAPSPASPPGPQGANPALSTWRAAEDGGAP